MKHCLIALLLLASCFSAAAKKLPEHLANLPENLLEKREDLVGRIKIGTINDNTIRDDEGGKVEVLKFHTYQDERDQLHYQLRVTLELTGNRGKGESCFAQLSKRTKSYPLEFTGEIDWEFQLPHGDLEKAKLTAYAIQYGFFEDGVFVPVEEQFDDVDCVDEITDRTNTRLKGLRLTDRTLWFREY